MLDYREGDLQFSIFKGREMELIEMLSEITESEKIFPESFLDYGCTH